MQDTGNLLRASAVIASIEAWGDVEIPEAEILRRIMNKYDLNRIEADAYMAKSKKSAGPNRIKMNVSPAVYFPIV